MEEREWLAERFETKRPHLRRIAYRMLGSLAEADDAVQETWLRLARADRSDIDNLDGWMTTVIARVCLDMLRSRKARGEESLDTHVPDPVVTRERALDPEEEAILADSVGLALLVVLDTLTPAERLAFVLHDMFDLSFDEIAADRRTLGCCNAASSPAALAVRVQERRRLQTLISVASERSSMHFSPRRAAATSMRFSLCSTRTSYSEPTPAAVLVGVSRVVRGAKTVASQALLFSSQNALVVRPALVNGRAGMVSWLPNGEPFSIAGFTVARGKIVAIDILTDPVRVKQIRFVGTQWLKSARVESAGGRVLLLLDRELHFRDVRLEEQCHGPIEHDSQSALPPRHLKQVVRAPEPPGEKPGELHAHHLRHGTCVTQRDHRAE